ncbi:MAG: dienelactone hydrolase family protein [Bacteriovoracaceae bacterium]|nr:dienelactone hydrolase family protein [Bacteriovoracaceae bacterium]
MKKSDLLINGRKNKPIFIMAHGAGAPMDSEWMNDISKLLVKKGIQVVRFEFPYMTERRESGKKRPPNTMKILTETWEKVISLYEGRSIFIGGKSMGGRVASLIADKSDINGLICLGFPFHAPGKEPKDRILHLQSIKVPTLILQGSRDPMGTFEDVKTYKLSKKIKISWLEDGDHGFKPRVKSGLTLQQHLEKSSEEIVKFIKLYSNV